MTDVRFPLSKQAIDYLVYFCRVTPADLPAAMHYASNTFVQQRLHERGIELAAARDEAGAA